MESFYVSEKGEVVSVPHADLVDISNHPWASCFTLYTEGNFSISVLCIRGGPSYYASAAFWENLKKEFNPESGVPQGSEKAGFFFRAKNSETGEPMQIPEMSMERIKKCIPENFQVEN